MNVSLLTNMKMPAIVGISISICRENFMFSRGHAQLSWAQRKFYNLEANLLSCTPSPFWNGICSARREITRPRIRFFLFSKDLFLEGSHYEPRLFKYKDNFISKTENFQIKNSDVIYISAQNIDCEYSLEPPRRGGSNEYLQFMFWAKIRKKIMYIHVNPSCTK